MILHEKVLAGSAGWHVGHQPIGTGLRLLKFLQRKLEHCLLARCLVSHVVSAEAWGLLCHRRGKWLSEVARVGDLLGFAGYL